jgi:uncharacterized phage protein (predicted DNA packaging)
MPVISVDDMKSELGLVGDDDDDLILRKIEAAQSYLEIQLGYRLDEEFTDGVPADLVAAVAMLAAHAYENREASIVGVTISAVPFGVEDTIRNRRRYSFGAV